MLFYIIDKFKLNGIICLVSDNISDGVFDVFHTNFIPSQTGLCKMTNTVKILSNLTTTIKSFAIEIIWWYVIYYLELHNLGIRVYNLMWVKKKHFPNWTLGSWRNILPHYTQLLYFKSNKIKARIIRAFKYFLFVLHDLMKWFFY